MDHYSCGKCGSDVPTSNRDLHNLRCKGVKKPVVVDLLGDNADSPAGTERARAFGDDLTNTAAPEVVDKSKKKKKGKDNLRRLKGDVAWEIKQLPNDYEDLSEEQYRDALTQNMGNVDFAKAMLVSQLKPKQTKKKQPKKKKPDLVAKLKCVLTMKKKGCV